MSYGMKYRMGFKDISDAETTWDVYIYQKDYAGAVTDIDDMGPAPIKFTFGETTRWMFRPVMMSDVELSLWSTSRLQYADLASSDATFNRMDVYYNSSLFWRGFIVTDTYDEPLELDSNPVRFMAADLKLLEEEQITLTGFNLPQEYAFHLLNKLNFDYGFRVAINTTGAFSIPAFYSAKIDAATFNGLNGLEALRELLKPYGATCYQANGKWHIIQVRERAKNYDYKDYDSSGTLTGTGTFSNVVATTNKNLSNYCNLLRGGSIQVLPPIKKFKIITELQNIENKVANADFSEYNDEFGWFHDWGTNTEVIQKFKGQEYFAVVKAYDSPDYLHYMWQQIPMHHTEMEESINQKIKIKGEYALWGFEGNDADLLIQITCNDGLGNIKFLAGENRPVLFPTPVGSVSENPTWWDYGDTSVNAARFIKLAENTETQEIGDLTFQSFELLAPTFNGLMSIHLLPPMDLSASASLILGACYKGFGVEIVDNEGETLPDKTSSTHIINALNNYEPDDIELLFDIPPDIVTTNEYEAYTNLLTPKNEYTYAEETGTLAALLAKQIMDAYATPPLMLRVALESDLFNIDSVLTDSEFSTRRFTPVYAELNPKYLTWTVDFINANTEADIIPDFYAPDFAGNDFYTGE